LIATASVVETGRLAGRPMDVRRFRPNIVIATTRSVPFEEDEWVRGVLRFGADAQSAAITITNRDERCGMVNFDPDTANADPEVLKSIVRTRGNRLGVYGSVTQPGQIRVGQPIFLDR
jgi:uncharacterized protein YcbX